MQNIKLKKYFLYYILFLSFFSIFYLFFKYPVANDSSISEWLINYKGGFTRRGLSGEILFNISSFFNLNLRFSIFLTQSILYLSFLILVFNYFKNLKINIIQLFALFAPIFLLYPVAEIEALGRKEIILFVFFISLIHFAGSKFSKNIVNLQIIIVLPFICFIWEQVALFFPFMGSVILIKNKFKTFKESFIKLLLIFLPSILSVIIIFAFPLSLDGHKIMANVLMNEFGERCYMSCRLLIINTIYFDSPYILEKVSFVPLFRYMCIFLIGFLPLNYLIFKSKFVKNQNFISKNFKVFSFFFLLYSPSLLLFLYGYDWGRWIHITYTFSILFYFYLFKNNLIKFKEEIRFNNLTNYINKKKFLLIFTFIIFSFGWNPKTVMTGDIASFPGYRVPYKAVKFLKVFKMRYTGSIN